MATENRIDRGDYYEVIIGEPTWDNPSVWGSRDIEWKPGTERSNELILWSRVATALTSNATFTNTPNAEISQAEALQQIKALTRQMNGLIRLLTREFSSTEDS